MPAIRGSVTLFNLLPTLPQADLALVGAAAAAAAACLATVVDPLAAATPSATGLAAALVR